MLLKTLVLSVLLFQKKALTKNFSVSKYSQLTDITVNATISGPVNNVAFLLNTLVLQTQRLSYKNITPKLIVKAKNSDESTYSQIFDFCLENDNITVEKYEEL